MPVYTLHHVHPEDDTYDEDVKLIGIYASRAEAEAAIARVVDQPGFRDVPDGFRIDEHVLGRDEWVEGYVRLDHG